MIPAVLYARRLGFPDTDEKLVLEEEYEKIQNNRNISCRSRGAELPYGVQSL
jgi:hypothetical protein